VLPLLEPLGLGEVAAVEAAVDEVGSLDPLEPGFDP
jgi:hypothetical protein